MRLPWEGAFVRVNEHGRWCFVRCVACGAALEDDYSRATGFGPQCRRTRPDEDRKALRENALARDREAWRMAHHEVPWSRTTEAGIETRPEPL